jgi:putative transposase
MGSPQGQQIMIPTPAPPHTRYGLGAVNDQTGETVVLFRRHQRRREVAERWQALVDRHPRGPIDMAWDHAKTHMDDDVEAVIRAAAGRLVLLYLPTYSHWLKPIEMWWRQVRREVTHSDLFASVKALLQAAQECVDRYHQCPQHMRSIIGSHAA